MTEPPIPDMEGLEVPLLENRVETEAPEAMVPEVLDAPQVYEQIRYPSLDDPIELPVYDLPKNANIQQSSLEEPEELEIRERTEKGVDNTNVTKTYIVHQVRPMKDTLF